MAAGALSSLRAQELGLNAAAYRQVAAMGRCPNSTQATRCTRPYGVGSLLRRYPCLTQLICAYDAAIWWHQTYIKLPRPCEPAWSSRQDSIKCRMPSEMRIMLPASTKHARMRNRWLLAVCLGDAYRSDTATLMCHSSMQHAVNTLSANNSSMQMFTYMHIPTVHAEP